MQDLLTMMRTTAVKMLFMLVRNQEIKLTSSFSLEMAAFRLCLPRTELMVRMHDSASTVSLKKERKKLVMYTIVNDRL
jgi:hypothetical protein